jgi:hypothetical protein
VALRVFEKISRDFPRAPTKEGLLARFLIFSSNPGRFKQGKLIGAYDFMIAGHARSQGLIVVTNNLREFLVCASKIGSGD